MELVGDEREEFLQKTFRFKKIQELEQEER